MRYALPLLAAAIFLHAAITNAHAAEAGLSAGGQDVNGKFESVGTEHHPNGK